jgi:hypothetical protein
MATTTLGQYAITLPVGSTRPGSPNAGDIRMDNSTASPYIEYWNGSVWLKLSPTLDGSSSTLSAQNATLIKNFTGTTTSGYYWITVAGTPRQLYCDMSGSQAWVLAMKLGNNTNTFGYNASYWTDTSALNNTSDPLTTTEIKSDYVWNNIQCNSMRLTASTSASSYTANPLVFTGFGGNTMYTIFNQGNNIYDSQVNIGRSAWLTWFSNSTGAASSLFDNEPNCNTDQINAYFNYNAVRIGISMNNEADCSSNDASIGFGHFKNVAGQNNLSAGGIDHQSNNRSPCYGWLWVAN